MKDKLKVEVTKEFYDRGGDHYFAVGEVYDVSNNELSDFYHVWNGSQLWLIPKSHAKKVGG